MSQKHIFGIIGAGMIAEKHIHSLQQVEGVTIKWVARQNASQLKPFQEKFNIPHGTVDYHEILQDSEVDAVVITSPPRLHYQMFMDALAAKKHILLEKPAAMKLEELDKMIAEHKKYPDIKVCDCSCRHARLQPKYKKVREIINTGILGDIYFIHHNAVARQSRPGIEYHPTAKWFLNKDIAGGGPAFDWGVYDLSFHLGLLSDQPRLENLDVLFMESKLDRVDPGTDTYNTEEHFGVTMKFSDQLSYYWERAANANMEENNQTRIYGTKGGIKLSFCSWDSNIIEIFDVENEGKGKARKEIIEVDMSNQDDDLEMARHFVDVLNDDADPQMPLDLAKKHLEIINKVYSK